MSTEHRAGVIPLPHPARVAGDVVRMILATSSDEDPADRRAVARSVIDLWRRNGLRGPSGAGVGGIRWGDGWMVAPVCLTGAWVGELGPDKEAAGHTAAQHRC